MKLIQKKVTVQYKNKSIECEKTVYACNFCDFELHEKWMEEKLQKQVEELYNELYGSKNWIFKPAFPLVLSNKR